MRLATVIAAAAVALTGGAAQAASVQIKDAVARVVVIPEARNDVQVQIIVPNSRLTFKVTTRGDRTTIDGKLGGRIKSCQGRGQAATVRVTGLGDIAYRDLPQLVIHTPRDVKLEAGGAVHGAVGRSANLELGVAGCGDWTLANVAGKLRLVQAGSGDTRTGSAGEAKLRVAGSGDVSTGAILSGLEVDMAGSGNVTAAAVNGPLNIDMAGSGDVKVAKGQVGVMTVTVAGSGDVDFRGSADTLKARIAGSGDVRARQVRGAVSRAIMGSGKVIIG